MNQSETIDKNRMSSRIRTPATAQRLQGGGISAGRPFSNSVRTRSRGWSGGESIRRSPNLVKGLLIVGCVVVLLSGCDRDMMRAGKVVGGSMANAAMGQHLECHCSDCQHRFACDPEQANQRQFLVCPNCGFDNIPRSSCTFESADSVAIQLGNRSVKRWDVIAFKMPDASEAGIKRVVGLPGERIAIEQGNILVDGELARKKIDDQRNMRILVHDTENHSPRRRFWNPVANSLRQLSPWRTDSSVLVFNSDRGHPELEWIEFYPGRNYSHEPGKRIEPAAIEDNYGFNQSLSRSLNPIDELYLSIQAEWSPNSTIGIRFDHRGRIHEFLVDAASGRLTVLCPDRDPQLITLDADIFAASSFELEFSSIDLQLELLINQQSVFHRILHATQGEVAVRPLQIGASGGEVNLHRVRIWRDVFYFGVRGAAEWQFDYEELDSGYILLGDNVPLSIDSRHWQPPVVRPGDILGTVKIDRIH